MSEGQRKQGACWDFHSPLVSNDTPQPLPPAVMEDAHPTPQVSTGTDEHVPLSGGNKAGPFASPASGLS